MYLINNQLGALNILGNKSGKAISRAFLRMRDLILPHEGNNYHPHLLRNKSLGAFLVVLTLLKIGVVGVEAFKPISEAKSSEITVSTIYSLTNQSREENNIPDLTYNLKLEAAAQSKADDMLAKGYFAHETPDGKTPWDFIIAQKYSYLAAGENLAIDFVQAEDVNDAWMHSPGHRANILNKNFEEIGVGISNGLFQGHRATFVVQMFGTPSVEPVSSLAKPTTVDQSLTTSGSSEASTLGKVEFASVSLLPKGKDIEVTTNLNSSVSRVLVSQGDVAFELNPQSNTTWQGQGALDINNPNSIIIKAYRGNTLVSQKVVASISKTVLGASTSATNSTSWNILGKHIVLTQLEQNIYLTIFIILIGLLILAIAVKRHVQHITLISNTAAACAFILLLWYVAQ